MLFRSQPKYVTQLEIYNGVDLAGFQNIVVEYSDIDAGGVVKTVPGADMRKSGTGATGSVLTVFTLPAPIHTDSIKISSITGPVIELAEVQVRGY